MPFTSDKNAPPARRQVELGVAFSLRNVINYLYTQVVVDAFKITQETHTSNEKK